MKYFGGKECAGTYQRIINLIPPHRVYIEPFLGGGAIWRMKRPARESHVVDLWAAAIDKLRELNPVPNTTFHIGDGLRFLHEYPWQGGEFVYCDPPYLPDTRKSRHRYHHELTREDHIHLLRILARIPAMVLISGYESKLYMTILQKWNHITFQAITRGSTMATEHLWYNYPHPTELHDYRYLGTDYTDRQRIRRKINRWVNKLNKLPTLERAAILSAIVPSRKQL